MTETQKKVLKQVVDVLNKNNIPFQVSGGLAAIAYGSKRPLYDIDIDVHKEDIPKIQKLFQEYIDEDFYNYKDEQVSLWMMTLNINGVDIDISQADEAYFTDREGNTKRMDTYLEKAKLMDIEGMQVPVMDKQDLIEYKKFLARDTDLEDVNQILLKAKV